MSANVLHARTRVLVVDDNHAVRSALVRLLARSHDLELLDAAESGEEAIEFALAGEPDVVLMDVSMPGIGGIEATRRLTERLPSCRVVGYSTHESEDSMRRAGAADFVHKSESHERLLEAIRG